MHHVGSKVVFSRLQGGYSITLFLNRFLTNITVFATIIIFVAVAFVSFTLFHSILFFNRFLSKKCILIYILTNEALDIMCYHIFKTHFVVITESLHMP